VDLGKIFVLFHRKEKQMKKLYYEKIKKLSVRLLAIILSFVLFMAGSNVVEAINFNGSQQAFYNLSNGEQVRIEYHGGEPHYHDSQGSANLSDGSAHHSNKKLPKKSTRDIMNGKKGKSKGDENARKKGQKWKKEWEKAKKNAKNSSKSFIKKNKNTISKAAKNGSVVVIIGGVVYVLWWLLKLASGWGILIPV
jgi:hypothetical protein